MAVVGILKSSSRLCRSIQIVHLSVDFIQSYTKISDFQVYEIKKSLTKGKIYFPRNNVVILFIINILYLNLLNIPIETLKHILLMHKQLF